MRVFLSKLFLFLSNLFKGKQQEAQGNYSVFTPDEQLIYSYFNGQTVVSKDPLTLYKRLLSVRPELVADLKIAGSIHPDAMKFHDSAIKKIQAMFEVKSFEEGGLTEIKIMDLFDHFITYCESVKKNVSPTQTSTMATLATTPSSSAENRPIQNTSVSGSTEKELPTEDQTPSVQLSESPLVSQVQETTIGKP